MCVFWFDTSEFRDDAAARTRRINDNLGGFALATWLSDALGEGGVSVTEPWEEDHGCDFYIEFEGKTFLCACCLEDDYEGARDRAGYVCFRRTKKLREFFARDDKSAEKKLSALLAEILAKRPELRNLKLGE